MWKVDRAILFKLNHLRKSIRISLKATLLTLLLFFKLLHLLYLVTYDINIDVVSRCVNDQWRRKYSTLSSLINTWPV